jgi:pimeloyl-ACP methyl ester carboxylesterase
VSEEKALNVGPADIEVTYERLGDLEAPPVPLVMPSRPAGPNSAHVVGASMGGMIAIEHPGRVRSLTW